MRARPNQLTSMRLTVLIVGLGLSVGLYATSRGLGGETVLCSLFCLGLVQLTDNERRQVGARVREALRRADISLKDAAAQMRMDPADLTRALDGERKLDLYRLEMLEGKFHTEWWPLLARDKGLPEMFHTWLKSLPVLFAAKEEKSA
jgi:hypothetical protein